MYPFTYHRPKSIEEAQKLMRNSADGGRPVAGGMSLLPMMKHRLAAPSDLFDLSEIDGLSGIRQDGESLIIGAMTRHVEVADSELVARVFPALAHLAGGIGDPLVRNRGTIAGSLAHCDPAACYPAGVLGTGATLCTTSREIAADDFFRGPFETALEAAELITAVRFPLPGMADYVKFANPASRFSIVGVFVARYANGVRVAVTGAGDRVFRVGAFEQTLAERFEADALEALEVPADGLLSDIHGSAAYRAHLITVLTQTAVENCLSR